MTGKNEGIIVSGGNVAADQIAVGKGAVARKVVYGTDGSDSLRQIQQQIEDLRAMLLQHASALPSAQELSRQTDEIAAELANPAPNRGRIASMFESMLSATKQVAELAASVVSLRDVVARALGIG